MGFTGSMIIGCVFIFAANIGVIYDFYRSWIKNNSLSICFPHWKGTNKHYKWWITWSIILFVNLITFIVITVFCFPFIEGVLFGLLVIYPATTLFIGFIYLIVKNILVQKYMDDD